MLKCEKCIHKKICIDGANYRNAEACRNFVNENDVAPVKHGHIVWKDRCRGGFKTAKCLNCTKGSVFCNHTAKYDDRHRCGDPYCSECEKLMGTFNKYCGNCGAKMDGGDENA